MAMAYYQTLFNYSRFVRYDSSAITVHRFGSVRQRNSHMRSDLLASPAKNTSLVKTGNINPNQFRLIQSIYHTKTTYSECAIQCP